MNDFSSKSARLLLALGILVSCVGYDQATKRLATQTLRGAPQRSYLANSVRLEYVLNPGGFLSIGGSLSPNVRFWLFTLANATLLFVVACHLIRNWNMRLALFVALVVFVAGGIGNLIDRVLHGGLVTDFVILGIGPLQDGHH